MSQSRDYSRLAKRIKKLEKKYDFKEDITTGPTSDQVDDLRAFEILCHAELEAYFETTALRILEKAEKKWKSKHCANYNLACLFLYAEAIKNRNFSIATMVGKAVTDYRRSVERNNGIKSDNIKKLYQPLGFKMDDFDSCFLSNLDQLGSQRGAFAHQSFKTIEITSKNDIFKKIDDIVEEIKDFESVLNEKMNGDI